MVLLKLRAVADKLERVGRARDEELMHERSRLQRHGQDCSTLFDWIDERGEFPALFALAREHAEVRELARLTTRWLITHAEVERQLGLGDLDRKLERLIGL
jgi:hypothetical protein